MMMMFVMKIIHLWHSNANQIDDDNGFLESCNEHVAIVGIELYVYLGYKWDNWGKMCGGKYACSEKAREN